MPCCFLFYRKMSVWGEVYLLPVLRELNIFALQYYIRCYLTPTLDNIEWRIFDKIIVNILFFKCWIIFLTWCAFQGLFGALLRILFGILFWQGLEGVGLNFLIRWLFIFFPLSADFKGDAAAVFFLRPYFLIFPSLTFSALLQLQWIYRRPPQICT